ncbi:hypothetical protein PCE1_003351 [Barthelona sp. PCE]
MMPKHVYITDIHPLLLEKNDAIIFHTEFFSIFLFFSILFPFGLILKIFQFDSSQKVFKKYLAVLDNLIFNEELRYNLGAKLPLLEENFHEFVHFSPQLRINGESVKQIQSRNSRPNSAEHRSMQERRFLKFWADVIKAAIPIVINQQITANPIPQKTPGVLEFFNTDNHHLLADFHGVRRSKLRTRNTVDLAPMENVENENENDLKLQRILTAVPSPRKSSNLPRLTKTFQKFKKRQSFTPGTIRQLSYENDLSISGNRVSFSIK